MKPSVISSNTAPSTSAITYKPDKQIAETYSSGTLLTERQPPLRSTAVTQTHSTSYLSTQKKEKELLNHLKLAQKRINVVKKKNMEFRKRLKLATKLQKSEAFNILTGKISQAAKLIIEAIVTQAGKSAKGRRFSTEQKIMCLTLYKSGGPKAYRIFSNICGLPKRSTLAKLLGKIEIKPGLNNEILNHLQIKVSKMPPVHRICIVAFDEMALSPSLQFNQKHDQISGFVDNGQTRMSTIADHVLVFMVRGVIKKYKQPIAYSFCKGTTSSIELKIQIKDVISKLQAMGFNVLATVCDQGKTNQAAINNLLQETKREYLRRDQEVTQDGFFELNGKKIVALYDPPHLMKCVRNNLITKNLQYTQNGVTKLAKWDHLLLLHKRSFGYSGVRLVPKLTAKHVIPKMIPRMRVKYATQIFSNTVAVALGFLASKLFYFNSIYYQLPPDYKISCVYPRSFKRKHQLLTVVKGERRH